MKRMIAFEVIAYLKKVVLPLFVVSVMGIAFFVLLSKYSGIFALFWKTIAFYVMFFLSMFVICLDKDERRKIFSFLKSKMGTRK